MNSSIHRKALAMCLCGACSIMLFGAAHAFDWRSSIVRYIPSAGCWVITAKGPATPQGPLNDYPYASVGKTRAIDIEGSRFEETGFHFDLGGIDYSGVLYELRSKRSSDAAMCIGPSSSFTAAYIRCHAAAAGMARGALVDAQDGIEMGGRGYVPAPGLDAVYARDVYDKCPALEGIDPNRAVACIEIAIGLDPTHMEAYSELGRMMLRSGKDPEAVIARIEGLIDRAGLSDETLLFKKRLSIFRLDSLAKTSEK